MIASTIGTAIEWYDFFLYSTVTGLVLRSYFSRIRTLGWARWRRLAFTPWGLSRGPIGLPSSAITASDRRESTLIATLLLMGLATFAVALVPTYASIGVWGAVILTILRFIQGVGVGGEWGGSV